MLLIGGARMFKEALGKLHNFRLLPVFVIVGMVIGIAVGKWYGISNFELTPPIDAIKSIFHGTYEFSMANTLALGVVELQLGSLLYV